ncbi:MAG: bifunctional phosphopantothenoylcysteine decarboxylase/phosphopantothenate--cysteine ligase CoaBC [Myxococcales bacterium]|nr:bifunctional phosphopantothenoylcysteine decarboxylase/phosphopantothenate--cysteine ligase CoaBC [Myxococcales bacterium]
MSSGPRILLAVGGGIAAYKAPELVRALKKEGCEVRVILTAAARSFVAELSLASVSGNPVRSTLLDAAEEGAIGHIELADWAEVVVVAPGTADLIARAAHGLADDFVTCVLLATRAPVLWAPAMNTNMWRHPATVANLATLRSRGAETIGPDRGELACGWIGEGRMIDPPVIAAAALALRERARGGDRWAGRRVLVTAGPTRTYLDPVRFVANASTGAMGFALAETAARLGAEVTLVAGPVDRPSPIGVARIDVETADEMLAACEGRLAAAPHDLVAMVAAVGDLALDAAPSKLDKGSLLGRLGGLEWRIGVDILATLVARHHPRTRFLGFAAQTVEGEGEVAEAALVELGVGKLEAKGADAVFVNRVGVPGLGFASPTNAGALILRGALVGADGHQVIASGPPVAKPALARWILSELGEALWGGEGSALNVRRGEA